MNTKLSEFIILKDMTKKKKRFQNMLTENRSNKINDISIEIKQKHHKYI